MAGPSETIKRPCPICGRAAQERYRPFCSSRCADIDLGRWLNESYRVPAKPDLEDEADSQPDEGDKPIH